VDLVGGLRAGHADEKVVRLDVPVDQRLVVNRLYAGKLNEGSAQALCGVVGAAYHLPGGHAHGLDAELAAAHVKEVLEIGPEEVDDQDIVESLLAEVVHMGYASCTAREC
jgi:hypothetical protein